MRQILLRLLSGFRFERVPPLNSLQLVTDVLWSTLESLWWLAGAAFLPPSTGYSLLASRATGSFFKLFLPSLLASKSLYFQQLINSWQEPNPHLGIKPGPRASKRQKLAVRIHPALPRGLWGVGDVMEARLWFILGSTFLGPYVRQMTGILKLMQLWTHVVSNC